MGSIVQELQREAMSSTSNISDMMRKSLLIAKKLEIREFENWVNQELNGYNTENLESIPDYREIFGELQWLNPVRGWCPAIIQDEKLEETLTRNKLTESITELEYFLKSDSDNLYLHLNQAVQNQLSNGYPSKFQLVFGKSQVQRIIDKVRNIILDWTLKLEKDGILGEGLSFSKEEKQVASKHNYTVNNFYGNANGVQIQQNTQYSTQTIINEMDFDKISNFISTLKENLKQIGLQEDKQNVIESEVATISTQLESIQPQSSVVKQSLMTIRNVLEGVTGSLIASGLLHELSKITI